MISMNWRPPRATAAISPAALPAANAGIRNRPSWNIGSATRRSIRTNATNSTAPPTIEPITDGLVQPIA